MEFFIQFAINWHTTLEYYLEKFSRDYLEKLSRDYLEILSRDFLEKLSRDYLEKLSRDFLEILSRDYLEKLSTLDFLIAVPGRLINFETFPGLEGPY